MDSGFYNFHNFYNELWSMSFSRGWRHYVDQTTYNIFFFLFPETASPR